MKPRTIWIQLLLMVVTMGLGLASRRYRQHLPDFVVDHAGDALWAMMVVFLVGLVLRRASTLQVTVLAGLACLAIELSQLYQAPWIVELRRNRLAALVLGHGFLWIDLVRYAFGVAGGALIDRWLGRRREASGAASGQPREVVVVPHDPAWSTQAEEMARRVRAALGETCTAVHHVGSTSVPGLAAKPILDFLGEVDDLAEVDARTAAMQALGFEALGEFGLPGRRYFRRIDAAGRRTHHVHVFGVGTTEARRHLVFRDYLRAHPEVAREYGELKQELARQHPRDIEAYMDGKDGFIKDVEARALAWAEASQPVS
ncbi:MAG: DUF2809 domain-containing protein [Acidobacteriota bacterium]